jgi:3',5'-cyclic AMP phosphodiesterase CpdA
VTADARAPVLLAQLTDAHVGADPGDPAAGALARAVEAVLAIRPRPVAVLVTGDLVDDATDAAYARVAELLAPLPMPVHVLGGNHDDRDAVRARFGLPGAPGTPVQHTAPAGPLRLVLADSTLPGLPGGGLDAERLAWLDARLAEAAPEPTILALHHAPLVTGVAAMDAIGFGADALAPLAEVLSRHPHVLRVVGGHVHRAAVATLGGRVVFACPSTHAQLLLDLTGPGLGFGTDPPAFALHRYAAGALTTHVVPVL